MNYVTLTNFISNHKEIIDNTINDEIFTTIRTDTGNVVIISENQFNILIEYLIYNRNL